MLNKSGVARLRSFPADAPIALLAFPLATCSFWRGKKKSLIREGSPRAGFSAAIISICVLLFQSRTRRETTHSMQYLENFTYVYQHHYHEVFSLTPNCLDCSLVFLYDPSLRNWFLSHSLDYYLLALRY